MVGLGQAWLHMMAQVAWRTPLVRATRWQRTHPTAHPPCRHATTAAAGASVGATSSKWLCTAPRQVGDVAAVREGLRRCILACPLHSGSWSTASPSPSAHAPAPLPAHALAQ